MNSFGAARSLRGQTAFTSLIAGTVAVLLHPTTAAPVPYLLFALAYYFESPV
jgi:hypothetical protein